MSERRAGIFLSYLNIALHAAVGFLYVPLLLHFIGKNEYGLYQLMGSLIAYFSVMDFGLSAAVVRFYAKYRTLGDKAGMENILALAMRGYLLVDGLLLLAGGICYFQLDSFFSGSMTAAELSEARDIFLLFLFNVAVTLSTMAFRSAINAHEKFLFLKGMETVQIALQPVLVVLILLRWPSAVSVTLAQTALNAALSAAHVYYCRAKLHIRIRYHTWDAALFRDFKQLVTSVFAVTLIDQVFWKTNQIILGVVSGTAAVAVYSVAALIFANYMALSTAISGVYLPHVTEMVARGEPPDRFSALFIRIGRWQYFLLGLVATGFIVFGRPFISAWAGADFSEAYVMTLLLILPYTVNLIQNTGQTILIARNLYHWRARIYLFAGALNLCLAIPLGIRYGGVGCAFATGISFFLGDGLMLNWVYKKILGLSIGRFCQEIGRISIPVVLCAIVGYAGNAFWESPSAAVFAVKILLYTAVYCAALYHFAMSEEEREKIRHALHRR